MNDTARSPLAKMAIIGPAAFLTSLGIGTVGLGLLFVVKGVYGASPSQVGWFGAIWAMSYFTGCIALRTLARRLRPRTAMSVMLVASIVTLGAFLAWPGLPQAFGAFALYGFTTAFFWPPLMGWLSRNLEGDSLSKATSIFSVSWSAGGVISPYLAGLLSERNKFLPIWVAIAIFGFNALFITASRLWLGYEPGEARAADTGNGKDRSTPLRFPAWLGAFLIYVVMGVIFNVFPVFARDELSMAESGVGLLLTMRSAATAIGFFVLGRWNSWQFKRLALPLLSASAALVLLILSFQTASLGFGLAFAAVGLVQAMVYNNSLFYATSGAPDRDKRSSVHEALLTAGQVFGSIGGGILYQAFSMPTVFGLLCALLALGSLGQVLMIRKLR